MSRPISVCAGEAACGTTSQRSNVTVPSPCSGRSTVESKLRYLRDRSRNYDRRFENTLLPPYHNHVRSSGNSSQPRGFAAGDLEPDQPAGYLISRARKLPGGLPGAVFLPLEPRCTTFEHMA